MYRYNIKNFSDFNVSIYIYLTDDIDLVNKAEKLDLDDDFNGGCQKLNNQHYVLIFKPVHFSASIIAHECSHLIDFIIDAFEEEISIPGNGEHRAVLIGKIVSKITKRFQDHIQKEK